MSEQDNTASFDVVIFDESDPVLAIVLPANSDTPTWYRDFEAVYDRDLRNPQKVFASWLVYRKFNYVSHPGRFDSMTVTLHSFDQELFHIVRVTFSRVGS